MFSKADIWKARNVYLPSFFLSRGYELKKDGHDRFRVVGFGGLILYNCTFYWHSKNLKGNSIDCLMAVFNYSFEEAVEALIGFKASDSFISAPATINSVQIKQINDFSLPELSSNQHRVFAYLSKTRKIHNDIIVFLLKNKLLFQDLRCNCVFPFYNENNTIVGAELVGTLSSVRFKGVVAGSDERYGFNIRLGSPRSLYVFEAPIDLLSYLCLFPDVFSQGNSYFLSLGGLKRSVLDTFLSFYQFENIYLCLDNDKEGVNGKKGWGGLDFADSLRSSLSFSPCFPPDPFKDWNEVLLNS